MKLKWHEYKSKEHFWVVVDRLADVVLTYVSGCVVEIGIGHSTRVLAKHSKDFGVKHYAVDTSPKKCEFASTELHDGLIVYNGKSLDFLKDFDDTPAIVFIDGCHHYEVVKEEVAILLPKIPEGGVMFLHDTLICEKQEEMTDKHRKYVKKGWWSDCYKARLDLEKDDSVWCMTFPYSAYGCGLTLVMKRPKFEYRPTSFKGAHI